MNIAFDAKRAFKNRTGLGNYSRSLVEALHQYYPQHQYLLYTPLLQGPSLFDQAFDMPRVKVIQSPGKLLSSFWRSFRIPYTLPKKDIQVYHGLSAELPAGNTPKGVKYVVTIHDLIFLRFPELYPALDRKIYWFKTKSACDKADLIIAISEQTKRDLVQYMKIPAQKIRVIYQTCNEIFEQSVPPEQLRAVAAKYKLPQRFLLSVGTIETRKNVLLIVKALKQLPADVALVLVGKKTDYSTEVEAYIREHDLQHRVKVLSDVGFADLPAIYQLATIFVYPSIFEGFGIPIVEAIKCRVPVIAATGSCLEEAGGPDSLYVHPSDDAALAAHIAHLWTREDKRQEQIVKALKYAERFTAAHFAGHTMQVYQELV
ncbi:glycosyltransferase family 4 protein [Edaphocola aurantiacus]|uniref:glycosyltransferase family 4 protein n=1 Tax=Edaphocola aurantiacus TaxID=2601682 RepID=UPI001C945116|nr:glycosyltransferase family 1 protein [Edaphocola aurantiacus]